MKVQKLFCTLSIMALIGLAVYLSITIKVPVPQWLDRDGTAPLFIGVGLVSGTCILVWWWYELSALICSGLRRKFGKEPLPEPQEFIE